MKIGQREYARRKGISSAYVSKLIGKGVIATDADGKVDEQEADEARRRRTRVGRGQRRWQRRHGTAFPAQQLGQVKPPGVTRVCIGCGGYFLPAQARSNGSPDPALFCEGSCATAVAAGKTRVEIRAQILKDLEKIGCSKKSLSGKALETPGVFDWVQPDGTPKVPPMGGAV